MTATPAPFFVASQAELDELLTRSKQMPCPRCQRTGLLVGHGLLMGYAERGNHREVRGRRLMCRARSRRPGCGRTFSVLLATVIPRFSVRTPTIWSFLEGVVAGMSRKSAWARLQAQGAPALSLRSGYRLWGRLLAAQSRVRTGLCRLAPPPTTADPRPIAQMAAHLRSALASPGCLLASFQLMSQGSVFG
jgi:hypothetical protein